ncbi:ESF1 homolog [Bufo gargarizans]|uniref:ESF1 homolog n=1 Tax=Bufo gargarizans TaxID=30331 RepID=UPI001CF191E7|nr:ESF1 homolog [Bufo gargarizans]XP_044145439.1 ESF1 homolog [Bufo gargarizans]
MASNQELTSDQRFSRVTKDPRFWEMPEKDKRIKIDKRFRAMFHDKKFNLKYTVDKRGRPVSHNTTEDLKRYYDLSDSDEDVLPDKETALDTKKEKKKAKQKKKEEPESKNTSAKIKEKKGAVTSEALNKSKVEKKVKTKGNILLKQINIEEEVKTKEEPSTSVTTKSGQKSTKVMEQEESEEESGLEDESDEYSSDEVHSHEEMSGMELEEDEESDGESEDGDDSEGEESEEAESEGAEDDEEAISGEEEDSDSGPDLARGKGNIETSSEEEDDSEDDELDLRQKEVEIEHSWREMDKDAPRGDEVTRRLAVCNMDWDRLKAKDLLALFNSFKPKGGIVFSVKIYPSEFGKEKLKEEELHGPSELKNITEDVSEEQKLNKERLREYQFKRLKYYFAVVECDTPETANKIYEECDGLEFESSCSFVDLRFIPDEVQFDDEPKDAAVDVDLSAYTPKYFTSAAMVTSKVELTWDETDQERVTTLNRPFKKNEILDMDFQAYLASSSEEEEEIEQETEVSAKPEDVKCKKGSKDDDEQIERYRQLVKGIQEKEKKQQEKDVEMEVKWVPGLKENAEQMVKNKLDGKDKLTPWEKYLQKQKDKKKLKRKKKESVEESTDEDDVPSDVDYNDPFFSEELKKPGLQKKSVGGKKQEDQESSADEEEKEKQKAEMALLMMDDVEDERKHFNYDEIVEQQNLSRSKKKKLKKKDKLVEDDFQINVEDSRFQALYTSHLYNVDPSDPNFKKTKAIEKVLEEKAKRREKEQKNYTETVKRQQENLETGDKTGTSARKAVDPALSLLLKSIKAKTQQFQASKKQKTK